MAELKNTFSWSFSAAEDFDECRRKRYWAKYAMWNGWKDDASELQRTAYRLSKMENTYSILGRAVEESAVWVIRQHQAGAPYSVDAAYEAAAKPFLNRAWKDSRTGLWKQNPRRHFCLREHYYGSWDEERQKQHVAAMIAHARRCIGVFIESVLPRLAHVRREQEVPVAVIGSGGDPESFAWNGVKIYAIPDYVYRDGPRFCIHDWKSGKPRERHRDQLNLYGLWAAEKHRAAPDAIAVSIEYLQDGTADARTLTPADLDAVKALIEGSVMEMAEYLVDGDIARNEPLPREDWDLSPDRRPCSLCNFYELCRPELDAAGGA